MVTKWCQADPHSAGQKANHFMVGFSFAANGAQNAPEHHSGAAGVPFCIAKSVKNHEKNSSPGWCQNSILDPKKLKTPRRYPAQLD